jgi:hypothetical protein
MNIFIACEYEQNKIYIYTGDEIVCDNAEAIEK